MSFDYTGEWFESSTLVLIHLPGAVRICRPLRGGAATRTGVCFSMPTCRPPGSVGTASCAMRSTARSVAHSASIDWASSCGIGSHSGVAIQERFSAAGSGDGFYALLPRPMPLRGGVLLKARPGLAVCFEFDLTLVAGIPAFSWDAFMKLLASGACCVDGAALLPKTAEASSAVVRGVPKRR